MILYIGGAYQGMLECACARYGFGEDRIGSCDHGLPDFRFLCLDHVEKFTLWCVRNNLDAVSLFVDRQEQWRQCVLICQDISCGVVPIDPEMRQWREMHGRLCRYLAGEAEAVYRVFCGLDLRLK